mgnify:CR=1 FL=1
MEHGETLSAQVSLTEERFEPLELPDDAFAHSLGVNQGTLGYLTQIEPDQLRAALTRLEQRA